VKALHKAANELAEFGRKAEDLKSLDTTYTAEQFLKNSRHHRKSS